MVDDDTLARALPPSRATGVRVCVHAEDGAAVESLIAAALAEGQDRSGRDPLRAPALASEADGHPPRRQARRRDRRVALRRAPLERGRAREPSWPPAPPASTSTPRRAPTTSISTSPISRPATRTSCARRRSALRPTAPRCGPPLGSRRDRGCSPPTTAPSPSPTAEEARSGDRLGRLHADPRRVERGRDPAVARLSRRTRRPNVARTLGRRDVRRAGPAVRARLHQGLDPSWPRRRSSWCSTRPRPAVWTPATCTPDADHSAYEGQSSPAGRPSPSAAERWSPPTASRPTPAPVAVGSYDGHRWSADHPSC